MSKGKYRIDGLTQKEFQAGMAAIKLVRGDVIKNAFIEGWCDGHEQALARYRDMPTIGEIECWERSHAKSLLDEPQGVNTHD